MNKLKTTKKLILVAVLALLAATFVPVVHAEHTWSTADIYYNQACGGCNQYLYDKLIPYLEDRGLQVEMHDYVNQPQARQQMNQLQQELEIPFSLQSHIMTFIGRDELIIGGHVPIQRVAELINAHQIPDRLVIYQDQMLEMASFDQQGVTYILWQPDAGIKEYPLDQSVDTYLHAWQAGKLESTTWQEKSLLPLVLSTGLLDGINPCAIAVLIFFIAFLFTLQSSVGRIFKFGLIYIGVIYLTYLGIGLGLFKAIIISGQPHLMAKIGAYMVIVLGLINIIGYYIPKFPVKLQIPKFSQNTLKKWLTKATLPAVIVGAFLVGLCTFPCSGGIYVAIIGLLTTQSGFWQGFGYLLAYNLMFVVPLLILLALAGNKRTLGKVATWQSQSDRGLKFWSGLTMLVLGLIILIWFV